MTFRRILQHKSESRQCKTDSSFKTDDRATSHLVLLPLHHLIHLLSATPSDPVQPVHSALKHCTTACSRLQTLKRRPWHCEPTSLFRFRSYSMSLCMYRRLVSRIGVDHCHPCHMAAQREKAVEIRLVTMGKFVFSGSS